MTLTHKGQTFLTDNDLEIVSLGKFPSSEIQNPKLRKIFEAEFGRTFLGGDELVAYAQSLVSTGMNLGELEQEILKDIEDPEKPELKEIIFGKTASGLGRGHSLGGLAGVVLGLHGTKMIDAGLQGLVASRSLVTSGRKRVAKTENLMIPEALKTHPELMKKYIEVSTDAVTSMKAIKERLKGVQGIETANKSLSYNGPADLMIVLPLDSLATFDFQARQDDANPNRDYAPREVIKLVEEAKEITRKAGMGTMYEQRIKVPRDTYFHNNVFKDPSFSNSALEEAEMRGMPLHPIVISHYKNMSPGFRKELDKLKTLAEEVRQVKDPAKMPQAAMRYMLAMRNLVGEFNENIRAQIIDSGSWRIHNEQKRHATLRQNVESIYSAAKRSSEIVDKVWDQIEKVHETGEGELPWEDLDKAFVTDSRLKRNPELAKEYVFHTARHLRLYKDMIEAGIQERDALFAVPRNTRVRMSEHYDLTNMVNMELPLRLCSECEPERYATSWEKRDAIAEVLPEIDYFLTPKCGVSVCTERKACHHIIKAHNPKLASIRNPEDYTPAIHKEVHKKMLSE